MYGAARKALESSGLRVVRSYVGEYITSLEMAGMSVTVTSLDAELLSMLDAPARTVRFVA
jgi:dihydroxyacetone kinase